MCIRLQKSTTKKLQNRSTKTSLLSRLMRLLHQKQLHMHQSHKLSSLHQRLPRHLEHWVMAIPQRLRLTDCTAPGLGRAILGMMHMRRMDVQMLLHHSLANNPLSHCHRTSAMYEPTSHLPLRCNVPPTYLHPLVLRPLDHFRHIQQLPLVCHSPLRRSINSLVLDLRFRDRKLHRHRVLHPARATEHLAFLRRSRAHPFQLHQKRIVHRRLLREPLIEVPCHPQGCQNVEMRCSQECLRPLLEQRNGINGVDQVFLR